MEPLTVEVQGGSSPIAYVYAGDTLDMVSLDMIGAGSIRH